MFRCSYIKADCLYHRLNFYCFSPESLTFICLRIRQIKCDETKPSCQKCTNAGRVRDGYSSTRKSPTEETGSSYQLAVRHPSVSKALTKTTLQDDQESCGFHFFWISHRATALLDVAVWILGQIDSTNKPVCSSGAALCHRAWFPWPKVKSKQPLDFGKPWGQHAPRICLRSISQSNQRASLAAFWGNWSVFRTRFGLLLPVYLFRIPPRKQHWDLYTFSGLDIILRSQVKPIKIKILCHDNPCSDWGDFVLTLLSYLVSLIHFMVFGSGNDDLNNFLSNNATHLKKLQNFFPIFKKQGKLWHC